MNKTSTVPYLLKPATPWVSKFVLVGCLLITVGTIFVAYKAQVIGSSLSSINSEQSTN